MASAPSVHHSSPAKPAEAAEETADEDATITEHVEQEEENATALIEEPDSAVTTAAVSAPAPQSAIQPSPRPTSLRPAFSTTKPPRIIQEHFDVATYKLDLAHGYVEANCRHCSSTIKGQRNVTSNFIQHMRRRHPDAYEQFAVKSTPRVKRPRISQPEPPAVEPHSANADAVEAGTTAPENAFASPTSAPAATPIARPPTASTSGAQPSRSRHGPGNGKSNLRERISAASVVASIVEAAAIEKHGPDITLERALVSPTYRGVIVTPCEFAERLSRKLNGHVWIKREDAQLSGSPIFRAAFNYISGTPTSRAGVLVGMPSAPAVALAAQRNNKPCMAYVPSTTPHATLRALQKYGANVHIAGESDAESSRIALSKAAIINRTYVDLAGKHLLTGYAEATAGYATLALEILQHLPLADKVFMAAGNALMFSGVSSVLQRLGQNAKLYAVRLADTPPAGGTGMDVEGSGHEVGTSTANGTDGQRVGAEDEEWIRGRPRPSWSTAAPTEAEDNDDGDWKAFVTETVTVSRAEMSMAVKSVFEDCDGTMLAPMGAISVAGAVKHYEKEQVPHGRYVCVVSDPLRDFEVLRMVTGDCERLDEEHFVATLDSDCRDDHIVTGLFASLYAMNENRPRITHLQYDGKWPFVMGVSVDNRERHVMHLSALGFRVQQTVAEVSPEDVYVGAAENVCRHVNALPEHTSVAYAVRIYEEQMAVLKFLAEPPADAIMRSFSYRHDGGELGCVVVKYTVSSTDRVIDVENELRMRCHSFRRV